MTTTPKADAPISSGSLFVRFVHEADAAPSARGQHVWVYRQRSDLERHKRPETTQFLAKD